MPYKYESLKSRNNEIRILKLLPSTDKSAPVCCELEIVSLNDNPIYKALSYCWADPPDPKIIKLNGHDKEVSIPLFFSLLLKCPVLMPCFHAHVDKYRGAKSLKCLAKN
jgi:hypothetical protein